LGKKIQLTFGHQTRISGDIYATSFVYLMRAELACALNRHRLSRRREFNPQR
jgi:hypothetical protein